MSPVGTKVGTRMANRWTAPWRRGRSDDAADGSPLGTAGRATRGTTQSDGPLRAVEDLRTAEILQAARAELAERGYDRTTITTVAARAGVARTVLHRRWSSKAELVVDAVAPTDHPALPGRQPRDTGSLADDLAALRSPTCDRRALWQALPGLVAELPDTPELAEVLRDRLARPHVALVRSLLERAAARGELRTEADLDLLARLPVAMVTHRLLADGLPVDAAYVAAVHDELLLALATGLTRSDQPLPA